MTTQPSVETRPRLLAETLSILFFALVVVAANGLHLFYILFPELGAIGSDVFLRPRGKWAREPLKLVATPTITAAIGIVISRQLPYGVGTILLASSLSIAVILGLKSSVSPAISAGVLPTVFAITSWLYPLCVLVSLSVLAAGLLVWRGTGPGLILAPQKQPDDQAIQVLESAPAGKGWFVALFVFVSVVGAAAQITGWRFILFPPLIVMAYEMLGHPETCAWANAPFTFPIVCSFAGLVGVLTDRWLGVTPIATSLVLAVTYGALKLARLRMPPALAIGLIPFVLSSPTLRYPLSVAIGTSALTTTFLLYRWFVSRSSLTESAVVTEAGSR